ncbi:hypothetical protein SADUNF_Sadunf03G0033800 [Salix dunnii]|uniref:AP2/ERF domain-containing protein n=1 Tax=Salix dunnii TaxID=1413687 RepID=A0A835N378_9ROSI|nr:hypothetical protein SADUNF_Sadunf03G0033800 [Salix dunnii]
MEAGSRDAHAEVSTPRYRGIRQRKWGTWVSEIREPGQKTRIWLGSYEKPEMAAVAYDVATLHLRGRGVKLNFPEMEDSLPRPASSRTEDVQAAAREAAFLFNRPVKCSDIVSWGSISSDVGFGPARVGLSTSQIQAINEAPLNSPKMWTEHLSESLLMGEPMAMENDIGVGCSEWEGIQQDSIWGYY